MSKPIRNKEDLQKSYDERIDQDFTGYPHHPSKGKDINLRRKQGRKTAGNRKIADAERHNGSANAFEGTEDPSSGEDDEK